MKRNLQQEQTNGDETETEPTSDDAEDPIVAFVAEHGRVVEEYTASDKSTAWLNGACLSWTGGNASANEVTGQ